MPTSLARVAVAAGRRAFRNDAKLVPAINAAAAALCDAGLSIDAAYAWIGRNARRLFDAIEATPKLFPTCNRLWAAANYTHLRRVERWLLIRKFTQVGDAGTYVRTLPCVQHFPHPTRIYEEVA